MLPGPEVELDPWDVAGVPAEEEEAVCCELETTGRDVPESGEEEETACCEVATAGRDVPESNEDAVPVADKAPPVPLELPPPLEF